MRFPEEEAQYKFKKFQLIYFSLLNFKDLFNNYVLTSSVSTGRAKIYPTSLAASASIVLSCKATSGASCSMRSSEHLGMGGTFFAFEEESVAPNTWEHSLLLRKKA